MICQMHGMYLKQCERKDTLIDSSLTVFAISVFFRVYRGFKNAFVGNKVKVFFTRWAVFCFY